MHLIRSARDSLLAQRGHMIGWVPVCLALGIGVYFSITFEPDRLVLGAVAGSGFACLFLCRLGPVAVRPVALGLALMCLGFCAAKYRTEAVSAPVLDFRFYGAIEGRIVGIDRSGSDAVRLTLDQVRLDRVAPDEMPERVRISLHGWRPETALRPGERVMTTGLLSPPSGPAEPGGYDFQRHAWFAGLGAVGYTRNPLLRAAEADTRDWRTRVFEARMAVSRGVQEALPGEAGAFAAAIMSGDRSGMGQDTLANLRASNLAHLLAISGLHMGLLTAFVFTCLRTGLMLVPAVGLRLPAKKLAALGALIAAAGYLTLSGGNVATERAFVMVSVMLVAVLLGRPALSLRAVAIAATIILMIQPEVLTGPGFQMSFAATVALVAVFRALRRVDQTRLPNWAKGAVAVFVSSLVAGVATAPIAAAHFNQISHYGLIANLASVPLMGAVIMPAAVLAAVLAPLGLAWVGLAVMGVGLRWVLWVAARVAGLDGALSHVPTPGGWVLPLIALGAMVVVLWQGRGRVAGIPVAACGFALWAMVERPAVLIAESGGLVGVMTPDGRALSRGKGDGFVAGVWLENDGAPVPQDQAGARDGIDRGERIYRVAVGEWQVVQVSGKTALAALTGCDGADVLISNQREIGERPCLALDAETLRRTGALSLDMTEDGDLAIKMAKLERGWRPWTGQRNGQRPIPNGRLQTREQTPFAALKP